MFDEIFNRWVTTNTLTQDDIIPVFLEYNQTFGDGQAKPEEVITLMQIFHTDYLAITNSLLKLIGIKKGYEWEEVWDLRTGQLLTKFFINK